MGGYCGFSFFKSLGPLFGLPKWVPETIRLCTMHIVNLGVSLWISGSILRTFVNDDCYEFFGDGTPNKLISYMHVYPELQVKAWNTTWPTPPCLPLQGTRCDGLAQRGPGSLRWAEACRWGAVSHARAYVSSLHLRLFEAKPSNNPGSLSTTGTSCKSGMSWSSARPPRKRLSLFAKLCSSSLNSPAAKDTCVLEYICLAERALESGLQRWPCRPKFHAA